MQTNIVKTLSYAQVFAFPLTEAELHQRFIGKKISPDKLKKFLEKLKIKSSHGYYYLGDIDQVKSRIKNQKYFKSKLHQAHKITKIIKIIPSIQAIIVTGTIAAKNPKKDDDIDFLIITKDNSLWLTRLLVNLLLDILSLRRTVKSTSFSNKACLNLWLTTKTLALPKSRQNLYTAYEIALALPIWDKNNTHNNFLFKNRWITNFLPNLKIPPKPPQLKKNKVSQPLSFLDLLAYKFQLWYMKPGQTNETISRNLAFFHPRNTKTEIETKFSKLVKINLKKYSL